MKRKPKKDKSIILRFLVLAVCGYFVFSLAGLWSEYNKRLEEYEIVKVEEKTKSNEIAELRAVLESDDDTAIIERAARERLGFIGPGEQVYVDVSGNH